MIQFNVQTSLNIPGLRRRHDRSLRATQLQLDNDVLKDSNYFIPKDTGELERSSIRSSLIGKGRLYWSTKYARKLYYNPDIIFRKEVNPNAQALWFEAAKSRRKEGWIEDVQRNYLDYFSRL
ncbi:minor capsid protein [Cytobacillus firmus]|uniref:Minor capsid protein n=1 Tax=Cytobacillus firmus TaxID=1399 RepID=A0AA46SCB9_CYTFI|nr:minor capsid protein [Cytobacillus firmus]UYG93188.1 minor capsid protein [Cytobacillus firmus]